jgi:hypothetical protein
MPDKTYTNLGKLREVAKGLRGVAHRINELLLHESVDRTAQLLFKIAALVAGAWWLGYTFWYAPTHKQEAAEQSGSARSEAALRRQISLVRVRMQLAPSIPDAKPRLEQLRGENLDIYLTTREFQEVPFPDRAEFINHIGTTWCAQVSCTFLPAVRFRDIETGQLLGTYWCCGILDFLNDKHRSPTNSNQR